MSTLYIGIEVPRSPQVMLDGSMRSNGEWQAGPHRLLARWLAMASELTPMEQVRLLTGAPDQAVYDLLELFPGVVECGLSDWVGNHSARAAGATPSDLVLLIRSQGVLANTGPIQAAIQLLESSPRLTRVEPAIRPQAWPLVDSYTVVGGIATSFASLIGVEAAELSKWGVPLPIFELTRLSAFRPGASLLGAGAATGFVWLEEDQAVALESPLDLLRAELICNNWQVPVGSRAPKA